MRERLQRTILFASHHQIGDIESSFDGKLRAVEYGVCCNRFVVPAARTTPRKFLSTVKIFFVFTFAAIEPLFPFQGF